MAHTLADKTDAGELARSESARLVGVDSLPFLTGTETGRMFLAAAAPRALARGMPAESCPAAAMAAGGPSEPRADVAVRALEDCLAALGAEHARCGCRIVALDNLIAVPLEDTGYATGSSARLRVASLGIDLLVVSEETGAGETLLRDLNGPIARLRHGPGETVTLEFLASGQHFAGHRIPVGFRRGRVAERIYAVDSDGNRLSLLIGFEPGELASSAAAWLAWPAGG